MTFQEEKTLANTLMEEGKLEDALSHYRSALELNPNYAEGYCNVGSILLDKGQLPEAEKCFRISLMKDNDLLEAYFNLGCLYEEKRDFEKALSFYKEVVLRQADDGETYLRMGGCARCLGREEDARAFWEEALRLQPNSLGAGARLAAFYVERREYARAEDVLRLCLVSYPEEVSLHFTFGLVLKEQKKFESALAQFNKVVSLDEKSAEGFYHLAECCVALELLEQAEPFFANAYKLDQAFSEPVLQLGMLYEKTEKMDSAVVMYRQWLEMVEDGVWRSDSKDRDVFKAVCSLAADYYVERDEVEQAAFFKEKAALIGEEGREGKGVESEAEEKDYRVSLQVDD